MAESVVFSISENFERNLKSIECFYQDRNASEKYSQLLDKLFDEVIPNLEAHPKIGFDFLAQRVGSLEESRRVDNIKEGLASGSSIRQYNDQSHIVLYHLKGKRLTLLLIKHQRQLEFDLRVWIEQGED